MDEHRRGHPPRPLQRSWPALSGAYDNFLIVVSIGVNALTIWYAWRWLA
jgi:hypothetical protein